MKEHDGDKSLDIYMKELIVHIYLFFHIYFLALSDERSVRFSKTVY